jgi:hypothetical protein
MTERHETWLRRAFIAGAIVDALALVPMLVPSFARLLWGIDTSGGAYRFAIGYAAALMAMWSVLLAWAARRPVERRAVAAMTVFVIYGLAAVEIVAVATGAIEVGRMIPTWILQAALLGWFATGYHGWIVGRARAEVTP